MHAFELVSANDDIGERGAVLQNKDGRCAPGVLVRVAWASAVVLFVAHIFNSRDSHGGGEGDDAAGASWDVERLSSAEGGQDGG